jgi:hypothetical protein
MNAPNTEVRELKNRRAIVRQHPDKGCLAHEVDNVRFIIE